jgi:hypothetical protein
MHPHCLVVVDRLFVFLSPPSKKLAPMQDTDFSPRSSDRERSAREQYTALFANSPIDKRELLYSQLSLYLPRQELARVLVLADIYRERVLTAAGVLMEFGTCWGRTAAVLTNLRGIFEPYNFTRKLLVFDTFAGLAGTEVKDGTDSLARDGAYSTTAGYDLHLDAVLDYHESESPISHIRKHEIVKGDAAVAVPRYLQEHPETIIAMAYFDFDIYQPTLACLAAIKPHLAKSSILVFDQLNCPGYPGETIALKEVFGLGAVSLVRSPITPWLSFMACDSVPF